MIVILQCPQVDYFLPVGLRFAIIFATLGDAAAPPPFSYLQGVPKKSATLPENPKKVKP